MTAALRTRAVAVLTAGLLATALLPAVAADCTDGLLSCDLTGAEQTRGELVTVRAIATAVPLRQDAEDPSVRADALLGYATLLQLHGAGFPLGADPAVGLAVRSTTSATGEEVVESTVAAYGHRDGENGWVVVSRTATAGAADQRAVGVPASAGAGAYDGDAASMSTADGTPALEVAFAAGAPVEDPVLTGFTVRDEPTFGVTPVLRGATPWRITEAARPRVPLRDVTGVDPVGAPGVTAVATPVGGAVTYAANPDVDLVNGDLPTAFFGGTTLADLIDVEGVAPGHRWQADVLLVVQADNTDDARGPLPVEPAPLPTEDLPTAPAAVAVAGTDVQAGGAVYVVNRHTLVAGTQLWQTNTDAQAHPVVCSDADGSFREDLCTTDGFNNTGEALPVLGTEDLAPGTYHYVCRIHSGNPSAASGMWGTFTVVGP
jgi:plastocyanin